MTAVRVGPVQVHRYKAMIYLGCVVGIYAGTAVAVRDGIDLGRRQIDRREGLEAIVANHFGVLVRVEQFVGTWIDIPNEVRFRLRSGPTAERLGHTTTLGASAFSVQTKFRLVLGPLDEPQFERLLPGGATLRRLDCWEMGTIW